MKKSEKKAVNKTQTKPETKPAAAKKDWSPRRNHNPDFVQVSALVAKRVAEDLHRHYAETDYPQADRTVVPHATIYALPPDELDELGRTHQAMVITEVKIGRSVKRNATNLRFVYTSANGVARSSIKIQP